MFKVIITLAILAWTSAINADVYTNFGAGTLGLGSATAIRYSDKDLMANYYTPAALTDWDQIKVSASLLYSVDMFKDLGSIVTDSKKYGSSSTVTGDVDTDTPDLSNLLLGVVVPSRTKKNSGLALFTSMPVGKFLSVETQSAYYPQFMMYQSDGQRMNASLQYFWRRPSNIDYSIGVHMFFVTGSTMVSRFPSSSDSEPSSSNIDLKVDVKPAFAPSFSMRYKSPKASSEYSMSIIGERNAKLAFNANNSINVFVSPIPIVVDGTSSLYYDPLQVNLSYKKKFSSSSMFLGVEWENWEKFQSSVMLMDISGANNFEQINVDRDFKNIVSPKFAWMYGNDKSWWSLGYSFRPSPVPFSLDEANYLDSDRHIIATSYNQSVDSIFGLIDTKAQWGIGLQIHKLQDRYIDKSESDSVGYPGYTISGEVYSLSVHIQTEL